MNGDPETATLIMQKPLNEALKLLRAALAGEGLEIAAELDMSGRIRKSLRINIPPCRVLCIDFPWRCWRHSRLIVRPRSCFRCTWSLPARTI